ncbi:MAG: DMT family transporter [Clostridia bacterium]|nr:DMT family transporter [Clostridia bacterium]
MKTKAFLLIIAAGVLWGTSGLFVNFLSPYGITSLQMTALRGMVSFLCMLVYVLLRDRKLLRVKWTELLLFAGIGVGIFGTATFYYASMQMTSVATAVVLMYTAPVYVMLFSVLFLKEKLTPLKLISLICMLIGCCLVSGVVGGLKFDLIGIALGILSGISYAAYNLLTKVAMQRGSSPVSATLYGFLAMTLVALCLCDVPSMAGVLSTKPAMMLPLMVLFGVMTCFLPYILYTLSMKTLPAGTAASLAIVEPLAATLFGVFLLNQALDAFSVVGIMLILLAVFLLGKDEAAS